jgi:hypothetical protein
LDLADSLKAESPDPEGSALTAETAELVWSAAQALDERQFKVLDLTIRYGMDREEVAELMGVNVAHASVLINRSRDALGNAVRTRLVATQSNRCDGLSRIVPADVSALTGEQHRSVDRHMRTCDACKAVASKLTDPAALFSAIGLLSLPQALKELKWNTNSQPALNSQLSSNFWRRNSRALVIGAAILGLIGLGTLGGVSLLPQHASIANSHRALASSAARPSLPIATTAPSPDQKWAQLTDEIRNANTYHVAYTNSSFASQFISRDLHVSKAGNWYGTITNTDTGPTPLTVSDSGGQMYAQGGAGFLNSHIFLGLTTQQAQALGSGWVSLTNDESSMESLIGMFLQPLVSPESLASALSPIGAVSEKTVANPDGSSSTQLNDGETTVTIAPDGTITFARAQESWVIDSINGLLAQPAPAPLKTVAQLKAAAP